MNNSLQIESLINIFKKVFESSIKGKTFKSFFLRKY